MRQNLVAGNWKMNGSMASARSLVAAIKQGIDRVALTQIVLCPPFIYLASMKRQLVGSMIAWGGQNLCDKDNGAYTGEVSGAMLRDVGCRYVIVGHSERRALYNESDVLVALKLAQALQVGLTPILCVGETLDERENGSTEAVVARQLDAVLSHVGVAEFARVIVAYEPVWAIGTGKTATPEQAQEVHGLIRRRIAERDATIAAGLQILYGGSVKASNAVDLFAMPDIDGGLIGGASLNADEFLTICRAAG